MGLIREDDIQEVRDRNNIVEVISEYVPLKKAGRSYKANCPFHNEKTPSFVVDPEKQLFHCFGCGEGGTVFSFVMKMDKQDFPETVKTLAERVGYTLSFESSGRARERASRTKSLFAACEEAAGFFSTSFWRDQGRPARDYLSGRGFDDGSLKHFGVGYAPPGWDNLLRHMLQRGFKAEVLARAGLVAAGQRGSHYDRFRDRVIFPIRDVKGRVVAFGARALHYPVPGRSDPKYLNSPETPLYSKRSILYGLYEGRAAIGGARRARVVEGYTDVIALYQEGHRDAVATMGTAFTVDHLRILARYADRVEFVFDSDAAGERAAERSLSLIGQSETDLRVVSLTKGQDPADFIRNQGAQALEQRSKRSVTLVEFCLNQSLARHDLSDPAARARAATDGLKIIGGLKNAVAQEEYIRLLGDKLNVNVETLAAEFSRITDRDRGPIETAKGSFENVQTLAERELLAGVMSFPEHAQLLHSLSEHHFSSPDYRDLFTDIKRHSSTGDLDPDALLRGGRGEGREKVLSGMMLGAGRAGAVEDPAAYLKDLAGRLELWHLDRKVAALKRELRQVSPAEDPGRHDQIFTELLGLEAAKREIMS